MTQAHRPIPVATADTLPFWQAAARGELALPKCGDCGRILSPPKPVCPDCLTEMLVWTTLSGQAQLRGWSRIHIAALPGHDGPVTVVEATLAEDTRAVIIALDETGFVEHLPPDAPLRIVMVADENGFSYPEVRSADGTDAP